VIAMGVNFIARVLRVFSMFNIHKKLALVILTFFLWSCVDEIDIKIINPDRGSQFLENEDVVVTVKSDIGPIYVNGEKISSGNSGRVTLAPVDGLGFIKAEKPNDSLFAVRSYLQGKFRSRNSFNSQTVRTRLGVGILNNEEVSFASLTSEMMENEELVDYVENPLIVETEIAYIPVTITVTVNSVKIPEIDITLYFVGETLYFHSLLHDVMIYYSAKAAGIDSTGTAFYEWMEVMGEVILTPEGSDLINMSASASEVDLTDDGGIPSQAFGPIIDALDEKVMEAISITTRNSSRIVFDTLMSRLIPEVHLEFDYPISQETQLESLNLVEDNVSLSYNTKMMAITPDVALPHHGILERDHNDTDTSEGMSISFGSGLVNQISFSIWDAGNTNNLIYTREQLVELGMDNLGGYYNRLDHSEINLLLPPILEWDSTGAWLVMGGIEMTMYMEGSDNTKAWTAGKVPVHFIQEGNSMILLMDESRQVVFFDVGFDKMSTMIDQDKVVGLLKTAMPGVVNDLFSKFPIIKMSSVELEKLNGDPGPKVLSILNYVETVDGFWRLNLSFEKQN
jgi:hypothetical protein